MRTPWRAVGLSLGFLLIVGVICAVALPYLNHLIYPDLLPRTALAGAIGYAATPDPDLRQIDELGVPDHIRTEADARAYIEALVKRWRPSEKDLPGVTQFEDRLAHAEYDAIHDPQRRIPESLVAKIFNGLVDQWGTPASSRISLEELHAFRIVYSSLLYPRSVLRLPDGSIAPDCRPSEALLLLDLLNFNGGVQPWLRKDVRARHWPWKILRRFEWRRPVQREQLEPIAYGLRPMYTRTPDNVQQDKYHEALHEYFVNHPFTSQQLADDVFAKLGIN